MMTNRHMWASVAIALAVAGTAMAADALPQVPTPRVVVPVEPMPPLQRVLPQDDVLPASLEAIAAHREDINAALVVVEMGQSDDNPRWMMGNIQMNVFLEKLMNLPQKPVLEDSIWPHLSRLNPHYRGVRVLLQTDSGRRFAPFMIFEGKMTAPNGAVIAEDRGRFMEYFAFGTARVRRDQMLGTLLLPVFSFEQCRLMGQKIVESAPRQCLLPDYNIMLETDEKPTLESARIKNFDDCLEHGKSLIYTFPRRCLAAGGRVLTEPPQVYEAKQAAKAALASSASLVEVVPRNTPVGLPARVTETRPILPQTSVTTVVQMPTPRTELPQVSTTAPVAVTSSSMSAAIAAARSVLTQVKNKISTTVPRKATPLPTGTLGH